jgi:GH24 family phage-related lysozyme (muramidase)
VLNSVFLSEAVKNGLDSAIVHPSKITPINRIPKEQLDVALDLVYDRRESDAQGNVIYDPLSKFLQLFENVEVTKSKIKSAFYLITKNKSIKEISKSFQSHFEELGPSISLCSQPKAFKTAWGLRSKTLSIQDAEDLLLHELHHTYLPGVLRNCPILLTDERKCNAVVDFVYNLGIGRLQTSTLKRKINAQDWDGAKEQLMLWTKGGGRVLPGLVKRRTAECRLF